MESPLEGFVTRIELANGGVVERGMDDHVDIGNGRLVPKRFRYIHPGGPDQPTFRFEFGVMNGIPVCIGLHIEAKEGVPVRTRDVKLARIDNLLMTAVTAVAVEPLEGSPGQYRKPYGNARFNEASADAARKVVKGKPRTRRHKDDVDLELVAETWRNAPAGSKTEALMTVFFCSKATAARYKKRAVEAGLLDG